MSTTTRRKWPHDKKLAVLREVNTSLEHQGTIQSVLEKHRISHGMWKRWNEEFGASSSNNQPLSSSPTELLKKVSLQDAIQALQLKRDFLNDIILELQRMGEQKL